jgi:chromatin-remodeling ATPase INO80
MSMMNLLSDDTSSAPARQPSPPIAAAPKQSPLQPASRKSSASTKIKDEITVAPRSRKSSHTEREPKMPPPVAPLAQQAPRPPPVPKQTGPPNLTIRDTERAFAEIEALDLSDIEHDAELFAKDKDEFMQKTNKRALEIQVQESQRRKRRRITLLQKWHDQFSTAADADRAAYIEVHKNEVEQEVRLKEVAFWARARCVMICASVVLQ